RRACDRIIRGARLGLPQHCELCMAVAGGALLCGECTAALPWLGDACGACALPTGGGAVCGAFLARPPPYAATIAGLVYAFPVDRLLQQLKYGGRLALADWAGETLADAVRGGFASRAEAARPDVV